MTKPVVIIETDIETDNLEELKSLAEVIVVDPSETEEEWIRCSRDAVAILNRKAKLTPRIIESAVNLKLISRTGVGVDSSRLDVETARKRNVTVTYNPGINADSVAELTLFLALSLERRIPQATKFMLDGDWKGVQGVRGHLVKGKRWGVVGFGNIGRRVVELASILGSDVLSYDPVVDPSFVRDKGATPVDLDNLLRNSDIVSLHLPLTEASFHMIGKKELSLMKKDSIIINVSRGGIIDEEALLEALESGTIGGAGLDTLEEEPIRPDSPLLEMSNVVVTPHIGGSAVESARKGWYMGIQEIIRFLRGEELLSVYKSV